jgi:hypothetical protein
MSVAKDPQRTARALSERLAGPSKRLARRVNGSENASTATTSERNLSRAMQPALFLVFFAVAWSPVTNKTDVPRPPPPVLHLMRGDDLRWAAADWDDRAWPTVKYSDLPARAGICWLRFRLALPDRPTSYFRSKPDQWSPDQAGFVINAITVNMAASSELYWDGRLIWRNGRVGADRASEVPGAVDMIGFIPDELRGPGEHVVAIRLSSAHFNFPGSEVFSFFFGVANYDAGTTYHQLQAIYPMIGMGCALVVAVIGGVLYWFVDRRPPLLLCALLGVAVAAYYLLASWRSLSVLLFRPHTYELIYPLGLAYNGLMTLIGWLLLGMFLGQFAIPRQRWWFAALSVLQTVVWAVTLNRWMIAGRTGLYQNPLWQCWAMLAVVAAASGWAAGQKRPGAWLALGAALLGLATVRISVAMASLLNEWFLATFALLVLALFTAIGLRVQAARRAAQAAELTAARMEVELLKKNLQPHFLFNTLAVLAEVVEQDPRGAVKLIDDLAEEFRTVARVSAEKLIPLAQELDLCRAHLRVMSVRTGHAWRLEAPGVDEAALVPPAVFLTLIENGFAHQRVTAGPAAFRLRTEHAADGATHYLFLSPGEVQTDSTRPAGGTGLRYVKARLEESFSGRWSLAGASVTEGWQTVITITDRAEGGRA